MDGVDTSLRRLAQFAGAEASRVPSLAADLAAVEAAAQDAIAAFDARAPHKTLPALSRGLARVRQLRQAVDASTLSAAPKAELVWRLDRKARDFEKALGLAQGLVVHVLAADGNVVRGQTFDVAVQVYNTGPEPMSLDAVALNVPNGWTATLAGGAPGDARLQPVRVARLQRDRRRRTRATRSRTGSRSRASIATRSRSPNITRCRGARRT